MLLPDWRRLVRRAWSQSRKDEEMQLDYSQPGATRCFIACPATGADREVTAIIYKDGGKLSFPIDFSSRGDTKQHEEAFPKWAAGGIKDCA